MNKFRLLWLVAFLGISILSCNWAMASAQAGEFSGKKIVSIEISGNIGITENEIKTAVASKAGDNFDLQKIKQDMQSIYGLGYFFDVNYKVSELPEGVKICYTVLENPVVYDIAIAGNHKVATEKILSMVTVSKGSVLNINKLSASARAIDNYYHDQGYIFAKVSDVGMSRGGILNITINEAKLEAIEVTGNPKTKPYVITREMKLKVGEPFNVKDAKRSMQKVYNLGYFEDVNMKPKPGNNPDNIILETSVVERKSINEVALGGANSTNDGWTGYTSLKFNNFRGTGDEVKFYWEFGGSTNNRNYDIGYKHPWLDNKETMIGFNIYDRTNQYRDYGWDNDNNKLRSAYEKNVKGFDITASRPTGEYHKTYITYSDRKDTYIKHKEGPDDYSNNSNYLKANFGVTRSITLQHVFDTRDNIFNPSEGNMLSVSTELAGRFLQGDFTYNKYIVEGRLYLPVHHKQVLAFRVKGGYGSDGLPENGKFLVGGADSLRGYEDDQFKGTRMLTASVEYRHPLGKKLHGVIFSDIGDAWTTNADFKKSIGVGLRIGTPIGPIRIDFAHGSEGNRTHFGFGGMF